MIESPFKPLEEGSFTYFAIQSRVTHLSGHGKPDGPLLVATDTKDGFGRPYVSEWGGMVGEYFACPWKNDKPIHKKCSDEKHSVWAKTGGCGWWSLSEAVSAMGRLMDASENGDLDYKDSYNKKTQAVRYEFRLVEISVSKKVELVSHADFVRGMK